MKKYILALFALLALGSCNDGYLEKTPIEKQTEATAFKTNDNFKTFAWGFYSTFADNGNYVQGLFGNYGNYRGDMWAGWLSEIGTNEPNPYRLGNLVTPTQASNGWDFNFIRRTNLMLSNIDKSLMSQADKDHWRAVGYFFRAYRYMELVSRFGDVPWVEDVIKEIETEKIFGKRTPRKEVTDKMLEQLQFAETHIRVAGDGKNTINTNVVRAFMSRFCLFEGTWRKYHNLGDYDKFLDECVRVSELIAAAYPTVDPNWDARQNSDDLSKYAGIIFYKEYVPTVLLGSTSHTERTSSGKYEMPKYTVESYLCADGKTIGNSPMYEGDKNMYDEFRNRDHRLLFSVVPPYCMAQEVKGGMNPPSFEFKVPAIYNGTGYYNVAGVDLMEYAKLLERLLPASSSKRLPVFNWSGTMNWLSPNINGPGQAPMASRSGYYMWQNYNLWEVNSNMASLNTADKPIFYVEEILLNLAEAKFEKGAFNQGVADQTINKLRPRAGVANMVVSDISAAFDPARDPMVDPVLWEIRRERMIELMGQGFGFQDIRRWKKGPFYINRIQVGTYIKKSDYVTYTKTGPSTKTPNAWTNLVLVDKNFGPKAGEGYLKRFDNPVSLGKGWNDKYYLFAIPMPQLLFNKNLEQNPGWEKPSV